MQTDLPGSFKDECHVGTAIWKRDFSSTKRVFPAKYGLHKEVEIPP
jgi:hypothetical protein